MNLQAKTPLEELSSNTATTGQLSRRRAYVVVAVVMIVIFAGMIVWHLRSTPAGRSVAAEVKTGSAAVPEDIVLADESQLKNSNVEPVAAREITVTRAVTGKVGFNEDRLTPIFAGYTGRVVEVLANKGDMVTRGQPLLVVESPEFVGAQNDLATARADVDKATVNLKTAQVNVERARNLFAQEAISKKDLQESEAALALAQDEQQRAQSALTVSEARMELFGKAPGEIDQLKGGIDRRVTMSAPIAGTIVDRQVGPGQIIRPDTSTPLFQISDLSMLWVQADVFESDVASIRMGAPVEISVESYPKRSFPARVSYIDPRVDPATRTVHVRCQVDNAGGLLKPDMFANVKIASGKRSVAVVPAGAVVAVGDKTVVMVEDAPGRFHRRVVRAGDEVDGTVTIEDGLKVGERIVTKGALLLNQRRPFRKSCNEQTSRNGAARAASGDRAGPGALARRGLRLPVFEYRGLPRSFTSDD
jgi:cobalt-zinc-cadmium efflux system membrane fusion protein